MIVINLYGGPGTGKSTTAADLFAKFKKEGYLVEYVQEYAKDIVWEGRNYLLADQLYILAKQNRRIQRLEGKVDIVVTDSPLLMGCVYIDPTCPIAKELECLTIAVADQYQNFNIFLRRVKPYQPAGRMQTEEQAKEKDTEIERLVMMVGEGWQGGVDADQGAAEEVFDIFKRWHSDVIPRTKPTPLSSRCDALCTCTAEAACRT